MGSLRMARALQNLRRHTMLRIIPKLHMSRVERRLPCTSGLDLPVPETRTDVLDLVCFLEGFLDGQEPSEQIGAALEVATHALAIIDEDPSLLPDGRHDCQIHDDLGQVLHRLRQSVANVELLTGRKFEQPGWIVFS